MTNNYDITLSKKEAQDIINNELRGQVENNIFYYTDINGRTENEKMTNYNLNIAKLMVSDLRLMSARLDFIEIDNILKKEINRISDELRRWASVIEETNLIIYDMMNVVTKTKDWKDIDVSLFYDIDTISIKSVIEEIEDSICVHACFESIIPGIQSYDDINGNNSKILYKLKRMYFQYNWLLMQSKNEINKTKALDNTEKSIFLLKENYLNMLLDTNQYSEKFSKIMTKITILDQFLE